MITNIINITCAVIVAVCFILAVINIRKLENTLKKQREHDEKFIAEVKQIIDAQNLNTTNGNRQREG